MGEHRSFLQKHDFLLRRVHSLTGLVPIGLFLIAHLVTNSSIVWGAWGLREHAAHYSARDGGAAYFHKEVGWINEQVPHLLLIEITLWASILFHAVYGLYIAKTGTSNVSRYGYAGNWRYTLQRISGYVGILFIFYHVATLRWGWTFLVPGNVQWSYQASVSTLAKALQGGSQGLTTWGLVVSAGYMLGVTMLVFHFANGLWTWAITWGLTVSKAAQRRWGYVCAGLGASLMFMAWGAVIGFVTVDARKAELIEAGLKTESRNMVEAASKDGHATPPR